ncbi:hypothetical protein [Acetobacter papayae]|uniref:hypothetical protein n=1 Tax=Acetobacter papayae TaxID=1076592 RepID=UPI000AB0EB32|nr:hypothetical protein [Acetobacter papayae]
MKSASENSRGPALLKAEPLLDVRQLSDVQFRSLGLQQVAYMRPATTEDGEEAAPFTRPTAPFWPWWKTWKQHGGLSCKMTWCPHRSSKGSWGQ